MGIAGSIRRGGPLRARWLAGAALLSSATLGAVAAQAQEPPPASDTVVTEVREVLVTARRREERAQDVPIALSVIGADQLAATDTTNVRELYRQVPSLSVSIPNARNTSLLIRGVGASLANDGLVNSVGVFVDGVYYARAGSGSFDLVDLDRVEVLRGPQGTLFGKNTTAGALNVVTKAPSFDFQGTGQLTVGDYDRVEARAMVSGPLSDTLALRLTAAYSRRDGFVENVRTGDDLNDFYDRSARAQLLWRPNEDFSLRIIGDFSRQSLDCCVNVPAFVATTLADGNPFPSGLYARSALLGYTPLPIDPFARRTDIDTGQVINQVQKGVSAEVNWNIPGHTLTSITAYRYWSFDPYNDLDLLGLPVLLEGAFHSSSRTFTQEVRLASTGDGPVDYVLGGYFLRETLFSYALQEFGSAAGVWILPNLPAAITTPSLEGFGGELRDKPVTRSLAAFGQATWHVTDSFDLTAGLRYTDEKKHGYALQTPFGGAPVSSLPAAIQPTVQVIRDATVPPFFYFEDQRQEDNFSGTVNAAWTIAPDVLAYASYARGYKSGGINFTVLPPGVERQVEPETADSYEAGLKTQFADRRITFNLSAYRTDFTDYQSTRVFVNAAGATVIFITNAGKVRTQGLEADFTTRATPDLTVRASAAYTDAKFASYLNAPCPQERFQSQFCDLSGRRLPLVSKYSGYLGIDYQHPAALFEMAGQAIFGFVYADYAWRSNFDGSASALSRIDGYGLVNLRLGLRTEDRRTELTLWARNLFDEEYFTGLSAVAFNTGLYGAELGDPRTVGVTLRRSF